MEYMIANIGKALVVDDNDVNTIVLAKMLELFDLHVDRAESGIQALDLLKKTEYDIIFLDHVMPVQNGLMTTKAIRRSKLNKKTVIIALSSGITDELRSQYHRIGANDIYSKPLSREDLSDILKQWCPHISLSVTVSLDYRELGNEASIVKALVSEISELNYKVGLRYAVGDPKNYVYILKVSLKDIGNCLNLVQKGFRDVQPGEILHGSHNMKSVLANIGALELADLARDMEQLVLKQEAAKLKDYYHYFITRITEFSSKLEKTIEKYDRICKELLPKEMPSHLMTREEYEQSLMNAIYYIKRFDYTAILQELELLLKRGYPEYLTQLELAIADIKGFQYENTLLRLLNIKKEMKQKAISMKPDYSD